MRPQTPLAFAPSMTFDNATQGPRLAARPASNAYPGPYGGRGPRAMAPGPTPQPMMGSLPRQMVPPQMMMGPQMMPRQMPPQAAMPMPASAFAMRQAAAMGPYGPGAVAPAGFAGPGGPMPMGGFHGPPGGFGGGPVSGCSHCNGYGCNHCLGEGAENGLGMGLGLANLLTPYAGGGYCAPRWFDFWADAVYLQREDVSRRVEFTSDGPRGNAPPVIVLSTDNLSFDDEFGFRATAAVQFLPGGSLEVSYLGQMNWESRAQVVSNTAPLADLLYSAFSDFGTTPPPAPPNNGGFTDTDAAEFARIEYSSTFDTIGLNYRSRWIAPNCRFQGSWIVGVRYFKLDEEFAHDIVVNYPDPNGGINPITGFLNYDVGTSNSMTGFQLGGDLWVTLYPGIRVGADVKAGLFGNRASQRTVVAAQSLANNVVETFESQQVALVSEANFTGLWRVNQHWTVRAGLQVLYIDGVALAAENVNFQPPFGVNPTRTPFINANGNIFYHGATMGLEYMW